MNRILFPLAFLLAMFLLIAGCSHTSPLAPSLRSDESGPAGSVGLTADRGGLPPNFKGGQSGSPASPLPGLFGGNMFSAALLLLAQ